MLEAIVADEQVHFGVRLQQGACGLNPVAPDGHRYSGPPCEQHRLIANLQRIAGGVHVVHTLGVSAVAPRYQPHTPALAL